VLTEKASGWVVRYADDVKVAQRFIAGFRRATDNQSARTAEMREIGSSGERYLSRPFHGLSFIFDVIPALKCWAIVISSAKDELYSR
jgi:hypothetical protein